MPPLTLAIAGALSIASGAAFCVVAREVSRRPVSDAPTRTARRAHAAWWLLLGVYLVFQGALTLLASRDGLTLGTYLASRAISIPLVCGASAGLAIYLVFLYTGSMRWAAPLAVLYLALASAFLYVTFSQPQTLVVRPWLVGLADEAPAIRAIYAFVGLPPILGSIALLALGARLQDRARRYRLFMLGGSILAYVGSGLVARLTAGDAVIFLSLVVLGLGAAAASVAAYHPPSFVRRALEEGR